MFFKICCHIECSAFIASFRVWNSSTGILSPSLALFVVMLPKTQFTLPSRMALSWPHHRCYLGHWDFLVYFFCVFLPPLLYLFSSARSFPFLSFIMPILAWNVPLIAPLFLKSSLVFSILFFPHSSFKKALSLFAIPLNSTLSISCPFSFTFHFLHPSAICEDSSENHFVFLHSFFFGMVLVTASCTMLCTSVHSSSDTV